MRWAVKQVGDTIENKERKLEKLFRKDIDDLTPWELEAIYHYFMVKQMRDKLLVAQSRLYDVDHLSDAAKNMEVEKKLRQIGLIDPVTRTMPQCWEGDHLKTRESIPELINEATTDGTNANWQPDGTDIWEIWGIHATALNDANVANRVLSLNILPGYHGVLAALPGSYIAGITGPTLTAGQQGGIWILGDGNYAYINDNGTVTRDAAIHNVMMPLYLYGAGALLGAETTNSQITDELGISAIGRKVA